MQPHRRQPTRLLCPWDSPGKNTGVGCHFLLQCIKVKSEKEVAQSCLTLSDPMDYSLPGSSIHGIFKAIKLTKTKHKERILKAAREKQQITYKGNPICLTVDLSAETLQARREGQDIFKVLTGKNLQPRLLYLARISVKIDGEIKKFSDKQKLREFSTTQSALQQMLKGLI